MSVIYNDAILPVDVGNVIGTALLCDQVAHKFRHVILRVAPWVRKLERANLFAINLDDVAAASCITTVARVKHDDLHSEVSLA